ncbi:hypothetical protein F4780DRAFT_607958 [Xylariomycetidae sp. FL0641]|nr:hypothetical protein F4780DRAFT_607958 [Xylariomycetidae sp. FL0641]
MALLTDLPNELLLAILEHLSCISLRTLLVAQRTNQRLCALARAAVFEPPPSPPPRSRYLDHTERHRRVRDFFNPFVYRLLKPLLVSFTALSGSDYAYRSCLPFRALPWAATPASREPYLRPCASWRRLPLLAGARDRGPPIDTLEVVVNVASAAGEGRDTVRFGQVVPADAGAGGGGGGGGAITLGLLYDLLVPNNGADGVSLLGHVYIGAWALLPRKRLRNVNILAASGCLVDIDALQVDWRSAEAHRTALIDMRGGLSDEDYNDVDVTPIRDGKPVDVTWTPSCIGVPPKLLWWQGPLMPLEMSKEYYGVL